MKRLLMATLAMIVAVGWAGAATAAAQTQDDTDFGGGTHAGTAIAAPDDLALSPAFDVAKEFDGTALPAGWEMDAVGSRRIRDRRRRDAHCRRGAGEHDGALRPGRSLDFAATFTADPFQHVGFGVAFENPPWAMFSTGGGGLAVGLYARTAVPGGPAENTPIAGVDPLVAHDYSIEWTPTEVRYFVDGNLVVTHPIAITAQLRPVASDFNVGGGSVRVEYVDLYSYPSSGPSRRASSTPATPAPPGGR